MTIDSTADKSEHHAWISLKIQAEADKMKM
jgi:hypothetical protein